MVQRQDGSLETIEADYTVVWQQEGSAVVPTFYNFRHLTGTLAVAVRLECAWDISYGADSPDHTVHAHLDEERSFPGL